MSLTTKMSFFENGLRAKVMSTELIIEANLPKKVLFEALELTQTFEANYSAYKESSLVGQINALAGVRPLQCSPDELDIFIQAKEIAQKSNGVFDPTIGVLSQGLYGFGKEKRKIPSKKELQEKKELVNYKDIIITDDSIMLAKKGMMLDLGAIGKGYIADKIYSFLETKGASKILINVGGEILTKGKLYRVAIKNPFTEGNTAVVVTTKEPMTLSTSGDYERFISSQKNHHILDNITASQNHYYTSITLLKNTRDATMLDAVATIAFNTKERELELLAQEFGVAIIAIKDTKEIYFKNFTNVNIKNLEMYPFTKGVI